MKTLPKVLIVVLLAGAIVAVVVLKGRNNQETQQAPEVSRPVSGTAQETEAVTTSAEAAAAGSIQAAPATERSSLPKLIDLGADKCIPCKMMAPILEELKKEYAGVFEVEFIDVWKNPDAGRQYGVQMIPTQIFFDATGKEVFRHTGYYGKEDIFAKWKELGVDVGSSGKESPSFSRWEPAQSDSRPKEAICYLCDGDINPKTRTVMKTPAGDVAFCSPHCCIITFASITDVNKTHEDAFVTDWGTGALVPVESAKYVYGMGADGRPTIKAFADEAPAKAEQGHAGGNVLAWAQLVEKEEATRCGFCDRPVYPEDAAVVRVNGMQTWGCCDMCALGVAARTGKDIEVETKDALTREPIHVKTFGGHVAELTPPTAVAWAGAKKDQEGKIVSTGCFKQAFFVNETNLRKWIEEHPMATGHEVTIEQALAAKMKLSPEQISKACKIGECAPK